MLRFTHAYFGYVIFKSGLSLTSYYSRRVINYYIVYVLVVIKVINVLELDK